MEKERAYYEEGDGKFQKLSDLLSFLVDDLKIYKTSITEGNKKKIEKNLEEMSAISEVLEGKVQTEFEILNRKINKFLEDPKDTEEVMKECVKLKNQLWEL